MHRDNVIDFFVGKGIQLLLSHFENAMFTAEPKPAPVIGNNLRNVIVKQPLRAGNSCVAAIFDTAKPAAGVAESIKYRPVPSANNGLTSGCR